MTSMYSKMSSATSSRDGCEVAVHAELEDEGQTVGIAPAPEIGTTAVDADDLDHEAEADSKVEIRDVVAYKGLTPGKTYTLTGTLMDKETVKPVQSGGKDVTATASFTPEKAEAPRIRRPREACPRLATRCLESRSHAWLQQPDAPWGSSP